MAERDAEGVLARWSRRKAAARSGAPEPEPGAPEHEQPGRDAGQAEHTPAAQPALARDPVPDLPDPDTLEAASDFRVFMQKGVPPDLRRRALRRLWRLDPAYRVGRGFLQELEAADKAAPPGAEPAREASASGAATAAASADDAAEEPHSAGVHSTVVPAKPPGDGRADAQTSREREPRRPRPLPRKS